MGFILVTGALLLGELPTKAQVKEEVEEKVEEKVEGRIDQRTDEAIDKGLDKIEKGIGKLFGKKKRKKTRTKSRNKCKRNLLISHRLKKPKVLLQKKNPPVDVTKNMILYRVVNQQFIMPVGSHVQHEDENRIEGTFYITGNFSLGTPSPSETATQCKNLVAYNPARPLAYIGAACERGMKLCNGMAGNHNYYSYGGPSADIYSESGKSPIY